ncbi:MAG TPA: hypothetical protein VHE37_09160, partial [Nevskiaceae bacterium]|nr:hypothetical protein [Nevskiaceae bacterium]
DGTLRNLTAEAGFGLPSGPQDGPNAIAVRQPTVHWSGTKAVFAMLVGGAPKQYAVSTSYWQIYEVTGLAQGDTAVITKLPCQPANYNNIAPLYTSDDQIVYVSDRPRDGQAFLYPQRDEYESQPIETGLWKLDLTHCSYKLLEHVVSGVTYPSIDSFGRLVFTRWDHLQRDQQADADQFENSSFKNGAFNYASETSSTVPTTTSLTEYFPELRDPKFSTPGGTSIAANYPYNAHTFNQFFPWMLRQDGSGEETINHVGRHELGGGYSQGNFRSDGNLHDTSIPGKYNGATYFLTGDHGTFHLREDPKHRGRYYGVNAPEFSTGTGGDLLYITGGPSVNPQSMKVTLVGKYSDYGQFRNPLPMADGTLVVVHTATTDVEKNTGTATAPQYSYAWRMRVVHPHTGGTLTLGSMVTGGINKSVSYWDPDQRVSWTGNLWELDPVEVRARTVPNNTSEPKMPDPEQQVLSAQGVDENLLKYWLKQNSLAMIVSRNVTTRDRADQQQPYNLQIAGSTTQTRGTTTGALYSISHLQLFQADQLRGYTNNGKTLENGGTVRPGRRPIAVPLHDSAAVSAMGAAYNAALNAVPLGSDGSMAAFVPAQRAMTWMLIDSSKSGWAQGIVRERNWLSFKPGERRVCSSCHGVNTVDQAGNAPPANPPEALGTLLTAWKDVVRNNCPNTGGTGHWAYPATFSSCDEGKQ